MNGWLVAGLCLVGWGLAVLFTLALCNVAARADRLSEEILRRMRR